VSKDDGKTLPGWTLLVNIAAPVMATMIRLPWLSSSVACFGKGALNAGTFVREGAGNADDAL
jgi:hypothetical protein